MTSPKLLLVLMAVASTFGAPQINERQVVGDVIAQLQPAIVQAMAGLNLGGRSSSSFSSRSSSATPVTRFAAAPVTRFTAAPAVTRFTAAPRSSSSSVSSLTSNVVSALQPSIAAAVAQALAGSRRPATTPMRPMRPDEENFGPAQYDFTYKVSNDDSQTYIARQENRDGDQVTGSYNYIDATGALVTVNYQAGPEGYTEERDVQKGAVAIRDMPGAWTGPLAGVDDVQTSSGTTSARESSSSSSSQSALIAQILAAIQPKIQSAVSSAVGSSQSSFGSRASGLGQSNFVSTRRGGSRFSSGQDNLINSVISSIQPRISSAVNSAIQSTRRVSVARPRIVTQARSQESGNIAGLFGGPEGNSVRIETPEFNIQY